MTDCRAFHLTSFAVLLVSNINIFYFIFLNSVVYVFMSKEELDGIVFQMFVIHDDIVRIIFDIVADI